MSTRPARSRSLLVPVLAGCGVLILCACVSGLGFAGFTYYNHSRAAIPEPAVEYLLDASPRMALPAEGGTRLTVAQAVLAEIVRPASPSVTAGLRVFGSGALANACQDTRLVVPLGLANQGSISTQLGLLQAGAAADAAMAEAMIAALRDLAAAAGPHTLVVVTGGTDSCNAQASELIALEAERAGVELELFVVGFQVPAVEADAIRGLVAQTAGATYLDAPDEKGLRAILKAIQQRVDNRASLPVTGILATAQAVAPLPLATPVAGLTREAAAQIVLDQVLLPDTLDHDAIVFAWPELLGPADELAPYAYPPFGLPPDPIDIPSDHWFFWIDDFPNGKFEHPNRYVLVDSLTGVPTVLDEAWWPVLNDEGLWITPEEYWNSENYVFSNFDGRPTDIAVARAGDAHLARLLGQGLAQGEGFGTALVLNGWEPGQPGGADMAADSQQIHDAFAGAGMLTSYLGPAEGLSVNRLDALTPSSFDAFFNANAPRLVAGDTLIVYGTGHGGRQPAGGYYQAGFDMVAFKNQLEKLEAGVDVVLIFDGSYSGLAISALLPFVDRIITATDARTPAAFDADHPTDPDPADRGSELSGGLAAQFAAQGADPLFTGSLLPRLAPGQTVFDARAALAYSSTLALDSHAVRGTTAPQMAPVFAFTVAENESPRPEDRLFGDYEVKTSYFAGNREHLFFIALPETPVVAVQDGPLVFNGPDPWVDVQGELNSDGTFEASGTGTVAGFPGVQVVFTGTLTVDGLQGFYTMGVDGKLPGGRSITYLIEGGSAAVTAPGATSTPPQESVETFVKSFAASRQLNLVQFLLARLHPAVLAVYGEKTCQAELQRRGPDSTYAMQVISVSGPADWDYTVDGRTTTIPNVYEVEVDLTAAGQASRQLTHFALVEGGYLTWFTDCGEPVS